MQVLYRLLANPEYIEPLRREVEAVVAEEGWTKAGMDKMHQIDSFVTETLRVDGITIRMSDSFNHPMGLVTQVPIADMRVLHFPSGHVPSRIAPVHIFQRYDHPRRHTRRPPSQCRP
jgi:hypothetical protein